MAAVRSAAEAQRDSEGGGTGARGKTRELENILSKLTHLIHAKNI
jgi:hypothetical protein